jgi:hypothetical protein
VCTHSAAAESAVGTSGAAAVAAADAESGFLCGSTHTPPNPDSGRY